MNKDWPTNEQIKNHVFNIQVIDSIKNFNYYARGALMMYEITKKEYLSIEKNRLNFIHEMSLLSSDAKNILKTIVSDL